MMLLRSRGHCFLCFADNFSELASQTEKFAAKLGKVGSGGALASGRGTSPDTLSTNSRSSSYSSVVSSGGGGGAGSGRQAIPRLALNVNDPSNMAAPPNLYETNKHPGVCSSHGGVQAYR